MAISSKNQSLAPVVGGVWGHNRNPDCPLAKYFYPRAWMKIISGVKAPVSHILDHTNYKRKESFQASRPSFFVNTLKRLRWSTGISDPSRTSRITNSSVTFSVATATPTQGVNQWTHRWHPNPPQCRCKQNKNMVRCVARNVIYGHPNQHPSPAWFVCSLAPTGQMDIERHQIVSTEHLRMNKIMGDTNRFVPF